MAYTNIDEMFEGLKSRFNAAKAKGDKALLSFELSGDNGGTFWMRVSDGAMEADKGAAPGEPDLILKATAEDMMKIMSGDLNPMTAFMAGKVKAERNMGIAMKLMTWFGM